MRRTPEPPSIHADLPPTPSPRGGGFLMAARVLFIAQCVAVALTIWAILNGGLAFFVPADNPLATATLTAMIITVPALMAAGLIFLAIAGIAASRRSPLSRAWIWALGATLLPLAVWSVYSALS